MRRLRHLEQENSKLTRVVADLQLEKAMIQGIFSEEF
jgi:hypothetical protein